MPTEYKPYILLVMFSIAIITLEMAVYGNEITQAIDEETYGIDKVPTFPTDTWKVDLLFFSFEMPNLISWIAFFGSMLIYLFTLLGIALTLPVDSIPPVVKIVILAPIWIMVMVLAYNALKTFIKAVGDLVPL